MTGLSTKNWLHLASNGVFSGVLLLSFALALTGCEEDPSVMKPALSKLVQEAQAASQEGNMAVARCRLESALSLSPESYQVAYNLGVVETQEMRWPEAISAYQKALDKKPKSPDALYGLTLAQRELALALLARVHSDKSQAPELQAEAGEALTACISSADLFLEVATDADPGRGRIIEAKAECESVLSANTH
jgi:tetratricopeptide (TPR) repeat protein